MTVDRALLWSNPRDDDPEMPEEYYDRARAELAGGDFPPDVLEKHIEDLAYELWQDDRRAWAEQFEEMRAGR
jgi:hypothetical protein